MAGLGAALDPVHAYVYTYVCVIYKLVFAMACVGGACASVCVFCVCVYVHGSDLLYIL